MNEEQFKSGTPGVYKAIPDAIYHQSKLLSNSAMSLLNADQGGCPAKFKHQQMQSTSEPLATPNSMSGAAMDIGTAIHSALLQPTEINNHVVRLPELNYRKKDDVAQWQEIRDANPGKVYLRPEVWDKVESIVDAVLNDEGQTFAREILSLAGDRELSIIEDVQGCRYTTKCKARIDMLAPEANTIVDLKTTRDASPAGFAKAVANRHYYRQAAFYKYMVEQATGNKVDYFVFLAIETHEPYLSGVYRIKPQDLMEGTNEFRKLIDVYGKCENHNEWEGYQVADQIIDLELPGWTFKKSSVSDLFDI